MLMESDFSPIGLVNIFCGLSNVAKPIPPPPPLLLPEYKFHSIRTLYPNKIIVSNKLLRLSRLGLGLGFGSFYMHEMQLELLNVVTNNLIGSAANLRSHLH